MSEAGLKAVGDAVGQGQYLTFRLATEEYGIDILSVQEIKGWSGATPLPESPHYLLGVINLRGSVVPIIDLRKRFGLPQADFGPTTVVIVARVEMADGVRIAGFVVDAVFLGGEPEGQVLPLPHPVADRLQTRFTHDLSPRPLRRPTV